MPQPDIFSQVAAHSRVIAAQERIIKDLQGQVEALRFRTSAPQEVGLSGVAAGASPLSWLQASPGSIWSALARLAWCNPEWIRAHVMTLDRWLEGAVDGGGVPVDGLALTAEDQVIAGTWYLIRRIDGFVERDAGNPVEDEAANYVTVQLEDENRQYPLFRSASRMGTFSGTKDRAAMPLEFDEAPLAYLPTARIRATFTPLAGFTTGVPSNVTQRTDRRVGLVLSGILVKAELVDNLIGMNAAQLRAGHLFDRPR